LLTCKGATTDIAIWSTVEQGLAITAGSLATLRPLFFLAMHQLGITTNPTGKRPSYGGQSGPLAMSNKSNNPRSAQKQDSYRPDVYKLSTVIETRKSMDSGHGASENIKSPGWGPTALPQVPAKDHKKLTKKHASDNESERSLNHGTKTSSSSIDEDPMQIMVSKTFYITDEERSLASRDPRDPPYR
jgi:hypothetical protein